MPARVFAADKVWIGSGARGPGADRGIAPRCGGCRASICCRCTTCSSWEEHLPALFAMKAAGPLRYVGITTSEGRRHREIE